MIKMKEPIKIKCLMDFITTGDAFGKKIMENYSFMSAYVNKEDLLHLLNQEPEELMPSYVTSITENINITEQNQVIVTMLNQIINRVLFTQSGKMSYQDTVYVEMMLRKLGISDTAIFLKTVKEGLKETYWKEKNLRFYREETENLQILKKETMKEENQTQTIDLLNQIWERLEMCENYQIVEKFSESVGFDRQYINHTELQLADYASSVLNMELYKEKRTVLGEIATIDDSDINRYERIVKEQIEIGGKVDRQQILTELIEASLFKIIHSVSMVRKTEFQKGEKTWCETGFEICNIVKDTLKRYEYFHENQMEWTADKWDLFQKNRIQMYQNENQILEKIKSNSTLELLKLEESQETETEQQDFISRLEEINKKNITTYKSEKLSKQEKYKNENFDNWKEQQELYQLFQHIKKIEEIRKTHGLSRWEKDERLLIEEKSIGIQKAVHTESEEVIQQEIQIETFIHPEEKKIEKSYMENYHTEHLTEQLQTNVLPIEKVLVTKEQNVDQEEIEKKNLYKEYAEPIEKQIENLIEQQQRDVLTTEKKVVIEEQKEEQTEKIKVFDEIKNQKYESAYTTETELQVEYSTEKEDVIRKELLKEQVTDTVSEFLTNKETQNAVQHENTYETNQLTENWKELRQTKISPVEELFVIEEQTEEKEVFSKIKQELDYKAETECNLESLKKETLEDILENTLEETDVLVRKKDKRNEFEYRTEKELHIEFLKKQEEKNLESVFPKGQEKEKNQDTQAPQELITDTVKEFLVREEIRNGNQLEVENVTKKEIEEILTTKETAEEIIEVFENIQEQKNEFVYGIEKETERNLQREILKDQVEQIPRELVTDTVNEFLIKEESQDKLQVEIRKENKQGIENIAEKEVEKILAVKDLAEETEGYEKFQNQNNESLYGLEKERYVDYLKEEERTLQSEFLREQETQTNQEIVEDTVNEFVTREEIQRKLQEEKRNVDQVELENIVQREIENVAQTDVEKFFSLEGQSKETQILGEKNNQPPQPMYIQEMERSDDSLEEKEINQPSKLKKEPKEQENQEVQESWKNRELIKDTVNEFVTREEMQRKLQEEKRNVDQVELENIVQKEIENVAQTDVENFFSLEGQSKETQILGEKNNQPPQPMYIQEMERSDDSLEEKEINQPSKLKKEPKEQENQEVQESWKNRELIKDTVNEFLTRKEIQNELQEEKRNVQQVELENITQKEAENTFLGEEQSEEGLEKTEVLSEQQAQSNELEYLPGKKSVDSLRKKERNLAIELTKAQKTQEIQEVQEIQRAKELVTDTVNEFLTRNEIQSELQQEKRNVKQVELENITEKEVENIFLKDDQCKRGLDETEVFGEKKDQNNELMYRREKERYAVSWEEKERNLSSELTREQKTREVQEIKRTKELVADTVNEFLAANKVENELHIESQNRKQAEIENVTQTEVEEITKRELQVEALRKGEGIPLSGFSKEKEVQEEQKPQRTKELVTDTINEFLIRKEEKRSIHQAEIDNVVQKDRKVRTEIENVAQEEIRKETRLEVIEELLRQDIKKPQTTISEAAIFKSGTYERITPVERIYRVEKNPMKADGESLENVGKSLINTTKNITTNHTQAEFMVSSKETFQEQTIRTESMKDINHLIQTNIRKEVNQITDQVYKKIEKKLQNERKRRGL